MIDKINILQNCKGRDISGNPSKKPPELFCIIPYHHELVIELGEKSFDAFPELPVGPNRRSPVFLIESVWNLEGYIGNVKEILLHLCIEISLVTENHTVMRFPLNILEIMYVVNVGGSHVLGVNDTAYPADSVQFIPVIPHPHRRAVTPGWSMVKVIFSHCTSAGPDILTDLDGFGVNAEYKFIPIHRPCYVFPNFFPKPCSQFSSLSLLSSGDEMRKQLPLLAFETFEKVVLAVYAIGLSRGRQSDHLKIREFGNDARTRDVSKLIDTISGKFFEYVENFCEFCDEVTHGYINVNQMFVHI